MRLLLSSVLFAALAGCSTTPATDMTATNAAIGQLGDKVDASAAKTDAAADKVAAAISGLSGKLDALAPEAPAAKPDPDVCTIPTGMTATTFDNDRHIAGTADALVNGMTIVSCDADGLQGWQAWHLDGLRLGTKGNGQEGLVVDAANNAVTIDDIRNGHYYSPKAHQTKGKKYTVACLPQFGTDACKAKPVEKSTATITIALPKGAKIITGGS
jgi:outer membrane murein-binding lipoprotein Lpp